MPIIDLKTAAARIFQTVDQRKRRGQPSPFFFIVGAGISHPPIPLARDIENHCKAEAEKYENTVPPGSPKAIDSYSHWFSQAYPSAEEVQHYLRGLMEDLPISKANLRLAHLLLDGSIARTVFTPNFDDMLTKALELFGERPLVCDHPLTVTRMRIESKDIQIIHVHGSYWFYDCCNLTQEIAERSGSTSMSVMLDQSLRDHSPLVIGYSGWEGDILMAALKRRLEAGRLGTPIYWFCYQRSTLESLPEWLIRPQHGNDICFVLPEELPAAKPAGLTIAAAGTEPTAQSNVSPGNKTSEPGPELRSSALTADRTLDRLVQRFNLPAPPLTKDPLGFYAARLSDLLGRADGKDVETDTYYSFHTVVGRVERARDAEAAKAPDSLQSVRDSMSKADYRGAIELASRIDLHRLAATDQREILLALLAASLGLNDNSLAELAGYELVVKVGDLLARAHSADSRVQEAVCRALRCKGVTLGMLNRSEEAIAIYDDVLSRFANAPEPAIRGQVAMALRGKGVTLSKLNRNEQAIAVYDDLLNRFANAPEPLIRSEVAMALRGKGVALSALNRPGEEIAVYDDLLSRFASAPEPAIRGQVAMALRSKGVTLGALNRSEEEIAVYDDLIRQFADAQEPAIREEVAIALRNKGVTLSALGRSEEAIAIYDDLLSRFANAPEPAIRGQVATGLRGKGITLGKLNRGEEAIAVYDDILSRFADAQEPAIRGQVAMALRGKGIMLSTLNRSEEAIAVYDDLLSRFGDAPDPAIRGEVAAALRGKGIRLGALNRSEEEIAVYDDLVRRFGDAQEPAIQEEVANALFSKGLTCESLQMKDAAIAAYEETVSRFSNSEQPILVKRAAEAKSQLANLRRNGAVSP